MLLPEPSSGGSFQKCPEGNHLAVCYEVIDLGTQEMRIQGEVKHKRMIWIGWETPAELMDDGRPYVIGKKYTLSGHEKSTLRQHLESWRGKRFTEEELGKFNIRNLIGAGCFLNVIHVDKGDRTYANIQAVTALPKGTATPELSNPPTYLSLEADAFDVTTFDGLSERMRENIAQSPEYRQLAEGGQPQMAAAAASGNDGDGTPF